MPKMMKITDTILGRYVIDDLIAEGGQASVARGTDQQTGNAVVIKQLAASPGQTYYDQELARFKRAANIRIGHPNVVDPIDFGQEDGEWYIIMPFIDGMHLESYVMAQGGRIPSDQAICLVLEIVEGLIAIHQKGYVHRDIKPTNIMIQPDGHVKILDMGICRKMNAKTITQGTGMLGSWPWMPREQLANPGNEDPRSDFYSLGAAFYYMLTGSAPVQGTDVATVAMSICQYVPPSPRQLDASVPEHLDQACMKLLAKLPEERFQTAQEFIQAISTPTPSVPSAPSVQAMLCASCGSQIQTVCRYCPTCGAPQHVGRCEPARCLACGTIVADIAVCPGCYRPFSHCDHRFNFNGGTLLGVIFRVPEGIYHVGRNELSSRDCHISRRHLFVSCTNGTVSVQDAGSTNKTYVAGQLADRLLVLSIGQELSIAGNTAIYTHN